ncbi:efflux RND transporter periplasmic adaptor subunit [Rhizobium lusitanum]|jgi:membrane fusion protein (multidrug efflux system)|uniref:Membrane fusion protein, multidrug efflux system n=2 Tax=Rhizobium/Agrobacterium group TaxID=227290 RepID=A0A1C3WSF7_9HYPH|nr:Multidrug resistance protein MdtA [Ensifer adhaerens]NTJ10399.1 efflux RND transporter periplasmic adaptor subunit [Rhizobium lusitanum]SCB42898.1 membrane fusion protein, multidrug efflux system [Rhizobium lusitanum]
MIKRMVIMLIVIGLILGGIFGFQAFKNRMIAAYLANLKAPPQTVSTITAAMSPWQTTLQSIGSFNAVQGANLSAQVQGIVQKIGFQDGQDVKNGDLIVQLLADQQIATLQQYQASAANAQIAYDRDSKLIKANTIAQSQVDSDLATWKAAQAQVASQQALIDQYSIRAPFDGHLGVRLVSLGQYLAAGTAVVTLQSLDPIQFDFSMPQQALSQLKVGQAVTATIDAYGSQTFDGKITAISPLVDSQSRNLTIRATFANPDRRLLPGMFGNVSVVVGEPQNYISLPQTAVTINPYGNVVYIVTDKGNGADGKPQLVANQKFVSTGQARGDQIAVTKGLNAGDVVVTSGQLKLNNGSPVIINNEVQPSNDPNANPANPN